MVGKIVDDTFIIYGVFDAKISKVLIKKDIDKFIQSINSLKQNKLELRYIHGKDYFKMFNKVAAHPNLEVIFGYFCPPHINYTKEMSKVISTYLLNHNKKSFEMIMGCHIMFSDSMISEIDKIVKSEQHELIDILEHNNTRIYDQDL